MFSVRPIVAGTAVVAVSLAAALTLATGARADDEIVWKSFPPDPTVVEATSPAGAVVDYALPTAVVDTTKQTPALVICVPAAGTLLPLGKTEVVCKAVTEDAVKTRAFTAIVRDTTAPVISGVPDTITRTATGKTTVVDYTLPRASDLVDGAVPVSCKPGPGAGFEVGTTTVKCLASDKAGNVAQASFTVVVSAPLDKTPPTISAVTDLAVEAQGRTTRVDYTPPAAKDDVDGSVQTACTPPPGTAFSLGRTTVTCKAVDAAGNTAVARFDVVVNDTTPPDLSAPEPLKVSVTDGAGVARSDAAITAFLAAAKAVDVVDGPVPVTNDAPATIPVGATSIAFTAVDKAGNRARKQVLVTVAQEQRAAPAAAVPTAPKTPPPTNAAPPPAPAPPGDPAPAATPPKTPATSSNDARARQPKRDANRMPSPAPRPPEQNATPARGAGEQASADPAPPVKSSRRASPLPEAAAPVAPKAESSIPNDESAAPQRERTKPEKQGTKAAVTKLLKSRPGSPLGLIAVLGLVAAVIALLAWGAVRALRAEPPAIPPGVDGADHPPPFRAVSRLAIDDAAPALPAAADGPAACEIALWHGYTKSHFYARAVGDDGVEIAYGESPSFRSHTVQNGDPEAAVREAHEELVQQLLADGWNVTGANGTWYSVRLSRLHH